MVYGKTQGDQHLVNSLIAVGQNQLGSAAMAGGNLAPGGACKFVFKWMAVFFGSAATPDMAKSDCRKGLTLGSTVTCAISGSVGRTPKHDLKTAKDLVHTRIELVTSRV